VDATDANTASKVVARDASGNFSAGTITAALSGNATSATNVAGGAANQIVFNTGSGATSFVVAPTASGQVLNWNGSAFTYVAGTISGIALGTNLNALTAGTYLTSAGTYDGGTARTFAVDATDANTASKVVARDASGNFSAGTITATLSGNATSATTSSSTSGNAATATVLQTARTINGVSFNGSANITVTANTTNALTLGTGLTGSSFNGSGAVTATVSYGTSAGTACQGNDSRLSDARQATNTNTQLASLGVGTGASGTGGEIRATNNITAFFSDDRLKTRLGGIENALDKCKTLDTFYYEANETAQALGYLPVRDVAVSAQQVQAIMPEVVAPAPIDDKYLTVRYERLVPLLLAAIKELEAKVTALEAKG
jgi:hypothetical protein